MPMISVETQDPFPQIEDVPFPMILYQYRWLVKCRMASLQTAMSIGPRQ